MWYGRDITVTKGTSQESPVDTNISLPWGTIERVIIFFRPGAMGFVGVTLLHGMHQFHPKDPQDYVSGDDYVYDMVENYELTEQPKFVTVRAWNTATKYDHTISVRLFVRELKGGLISRAARTLLGMAE